MGKHPGWSEWLMWQVERIFTVCSLAPQLQESSHGLSFLLYCDIESILFCLISSRILTIYLKTIGEGRAWVTREAGWRQRAKGQRKRAGMGRGEGERQKRAFLVWVCKTRLFLSLGWRRSKNWCPNHKYERRKVSRMKKKERLVRFVYTCFLNYNSFWYNTQ